MTEEKLKEFNEKLTALLTEYNYSLTVGYNIQVKENPPVGETTGKEEVKTSEPTSTEETK